MKLWMQLCFGMIGAVVLMSCTSVEPIRIQPPSGSPTLMPRPTLTAKEAAKGRTGTYTKDENRRIIEEYEKYFIGFAEFDDQGWAYSNVRQLDIIKARIAADLAEPKYKDDDFLVLVFIHGWHHNAHDNDGNVQQFRQMVDIAANGLEDSIKSHILTTRRHVIGIYVGWRGESVESSPLNYLTVLDRRNAAERVAQGAVRQLFANLRIQQLEAQNIFGSKCPTQARMRTVVIGHSFGGLIAFTALAQAELNELTLLRSVNPGVCNDDGSPMLGGHLAPLWPDALILINPAFEASRYESFDRLMKSPAVPPSPSPATATAAAATAADHLIVPHFIVVASETDQWTGSAFTVGRRVTTTFEKYVSAPPEATRAEREANLHSIARVEAYRTHRLDLEPGASGTPDTSEAPGAKAIAHLKPGLTAPFASPVWVVLAADAVVHGHDGFLYGRGSDKRNPQPYLADWLLQLYDMDCTAAPQVAGCTKETP